MVVVRVRQKSLKIKNNTQKPCHFSEMCILTQFKNSSLEEAGVETDLKPDLQGPKIAYANAH